MEKAQPSSCTFFPSPVSSKWEESRVKVLSGKIPSPAPCPLPHPRWGRATEDPFNPMSVDIKSTRDLVNNIHSQPILRKWDSGGLEISIIQKLPGILLCSSLSSVVQKKGTAWHVFLVDPGEKI